MQRHFRHIITPERSLFWPKLRSASVAKLRMESVVKTMGATKDAQQGFGDYE